MLLALTCMLFVVYSHVWLGKYGIVQMASGMWVVLLLVVVCIVPRKAGLGGGIEWPWLVLDIVNSILTAALFALLVIVQRKLLT